LAAENQNLRGKPAAMATWPRAEKYTVYFIDKLCVSLNGTRKVVGVLRGYEAFLNVVLEEAVDENIDNQPSVMTIVL
jgi:small nuclear ribonucleoprotein (snRNP)-like protein